MRKPTDTGSVILLALAAALFYALATPGSKLLLGETGPTMMAAFLYLGAGIGVGIMYLVQKPTHREELLEKKDLPYTIGMVVLDIAAPILLMIGISLSTAASASLLGNFEIVATTLFALLIFKERVSKWLWLGIIAIMAASMLLTLDGSGEFAFSSGSLFVLAAAVCWGLENNCTRSISDKSTHQIVTIKGLFSGAGSLVIALTIGEILPNWDVMLWALLLGFVAYGLSIFTYVRAQRSLGAAKTSAYYAVAPFVGALLSSLFLHESLSEIYFWALAVMAVGTLFVVTDTLGFEHAHEHEHTVCLNGENGPAVCTVRHSHPHRHSGNSKRHSHHHPRRELLSLARQPRSER